MEALKNNNLGLEQPASLPRDATQEFRISSAPKMYYTSLRHEFASFNFLSISMFSIQTQLLYFSTTYLHIATYIHSHSRMYCLQQTFIVFSYPDISANNFEISNFLKSLKDYIRMAKLKPYLDRFLNLTRKREEGTGV